jgi:hypothetical protein
MLKIKLQNMSMRLQHEKQVLSAKSELNIQINAYMSRDSSAA